MRRHERVTALGFKDYDDYLRSPAWRAVKARYRASGMPMNCMCGATDVQIHHLTYDRVGGDELNEDLVPLCRHCHRMAHDLEARGEIGLDLHGLYDAQRAARHRAAILLAEEQRELKRTLFHELPVDERVKRLVDANRKHGNVIREEIRSLERQISRLEAKALRIDDVRGIDQRLRIFEGRLTDRRPVALDDLMPELGRERIRLRAVTTPPATGCDGSMTCTCKRCEAGRDDRVRRGVHGRIADADPLRAVRRTRSRPIRARREYEVPPEFEAKYGAA